MDWLSFDHIFSFCEENFLILFIYIIVICSNVTFHLLINFIIEKLDKFGETKKKSIKNEDLLNVLKNKIIELEKKNNAEKNNSVSSKKKNESEYKDFVCLIERMSNWLSLIDSNVKVLQDSVNEIQMNNLNNNKLDDISVVVNNNLNDFEKKISESIDKISLIKSNIETEFSIIKSFMNDNSKDIKSLSDINSLPVNIISLKKEESKKDKEESKKDLLQKEVKMYIDFFQSIDKKAGNNDFTNNFVNSFTIPFIVSVVGVSKKYFPECYFLPIAIPNYYKKNMYYERINDPINTYYQFENEYQSFCRHSKILDSQNVFLQRYLNESDDEYDTRLLEIILNHFKNIYVVYKTGLHFGFRLKTPRITNHT